MHAANAQKQSIVALSDSEATEPKAIKNTTVPLTKTDSAVTDPLDKNGPWPDQDLNRLIAMMERLNINEITQIECLETLIYLSSRRQDSRALAQAAIKTYGSLSKLFEQPGRDLRAVLSLDKVTTALIVVAKASMRYILLKDIEDRIELASGDALIDYLAFDLRHSSQEILRVIYLDAKCKIIKDQEMARGTVNTVHIYPREVIKNAIIYGASSVILAHNHLSDDATPSRKDIEVTQKTKNALEFLNITLSDHIIISRKSSLSMKQEGYF